MESHRRSILTASFFMTDFLRAQLPFIASLQNSLAPSSTLVSFWKYITILGNEEFFLLMIPLVYWCISSRRGLQLGALVIGGDALNVLLKLLFALPRPYWVDDSVRALSTDPSFGLPSSHAQNALAVWLFLAYVASKKYGRFRPYFFGGAILLIALISLSRVVLGVHFPSDILGGWIFGIFILAGYFVLEPRLSDSWKYMLTAERIRWVAIMFFVLCLLSVGCISKAKHVDSNAVFPVHVGSFVAGLEMRWMTYHAATVRGTEAVFARGGALFGLLMGLVFLAESRFDANGTLRQKVLRFLIGFVGILIIWRGLATVFPKGESDVALVFRFVRYALLTLWVTWLWPLLWNRQKLGKGISPLAAVD
jgi:membrane-associated phospholipid phosphatase